MITSHLFQRGTAELREPSSGNGLAGLTNAYLAPVFPWWGVSPDERQRLLLHNTQPSTVPTTFYFCIGAID